MKIVIVSEWFSELMGYSDNCLPRALAAHGHEIHLVTSELKPYATTPFYGEVYEPFLGPPTVPAGSFALDDVTVHRLRHFDVRGRIGLRGLTPLLQRLRPDVVQVMSHVSFAAIQAALAHPRLRYALFTANHVLPSVFPPAAPSASRADRLKIRLTLAAPGRIVSSRIRRCYGATADAAELAVRFFGVPREKVAVRPLGVDTDVFHPVQSDDDQIDRARMRTELGVADDEVLCLYSGRFSEGKDPALLADALDRLAADAVAIRGLFIGDGPQADRIERHPGAIVVPFVPFRELGRHYRAADIGVWPRQESMSVLDAKACGLPVVISDRVVAADRRQAAALYVEGDAASLAETLRTLLDESRRAALGAEALALVESQSWRAVAADRLSDYSAALAGRDLPPA